MRDMCLRLEAEVAKLRNLLASAHGAGPSQVDLPQAPGGGAGGAGGGAAVGGGNFLSGFAGGGGRGGIPRMSHMVGG